MDATADNDVGAIVASLALDMVNGIIGELQYAVNAMFDLIKGLGGDLSGQ